MNCSYFLKARFFTYSSRFSQSLTDQDFAIISIQVSNLNGITTLVTPIKISSNPIYGQTIWILQGLQMFNFGIVAHFSQTRSSGCYIGPKNTIGFDIVIYRGKAKYLITVILDPVLAVFQIWFHKKFIVTKIYYIHTSELCNFAKFLLQHKLIYSLFL